MGTWLSPEKTVPATGVALSIGYKLERGGAGKRIAVMDLTKAKPGVAEKVKRDATKLKLREDAPGRYISEDDCMWRVEGDHIVVARDASGSGAESETEVAYRLSEDGSSLEPGSVKDAEFVAAGPLKPRLTRVEE